MPDQTVHCVVERAAKLSEPTRKTSLHEPLAYDNAYAHSMRYRAFNDDGTEADLTGYSVVGAFTPSGCNTIKPLLNGTVSGNVAELILPSACYKHPGRFKFTMNLNKGSVSRSVLWVEGMVERNQTDTIEAPTEVLDVSQVITDAQTATANANAAVDRANSIADSLVNDSVNAITAAGTQQRQSVNDLGDQLKDYLEDHYGETTDKVAAKANRSSVSTVKHAIGADGQLTLTDALNEPAKKMTIHLEPKQDLHGYDHPWVGGSGKNLLQNGGVFDTTVNGIRFTSDGNGSYTISGTATADAAYDFNINETIFPSTVYLHFLNNAATYNVAFVFINGTTQVYAPTPNVINRIADVSADLGGKTVTKLRLFVSNGATVNIALSPMMCTDNTVKAFAPYSNICPIEGFDSVEVVSTGKNLFDKNNLDQTRGYLTYPSALISNSANYRVSNWIRVNAGEKYTVSNGTTRGESPSYAWYDENRNLLQVTYHHSGGFPQTYTAPDGAYWLRESVHVSDLDTFMLEKGATASSYEPFGNAISLNLVSSAGSTVYGGTVTVNEDGSGTLVVDTEYEDFGDMTWVYNDDGRFKGTPKTYVKGYMTANARTVDFHCSCYKVISDSSPYDATLNGAIYYAAKLFWVQDNRYTDATQYKTAMTGQTIAYPIDAPRTYNLTATQLQTLLGTNHIWTDGTNIDLDYYSDRYAEIDKLYAALENRTDKIMSALTPYVEETMVATRNYIAGEILSVGTNLYKTTTAIANGASLTVGTNVENTTLTTGAANGITINATPASAMSIDGGWVNVTLDKTNAEIIQAASSGKSIVKLQNYGATIICRQAEYTSYAVYFHGVSIDNSLLIYNVMVTSSSAQAALVGSVAMTR